MRVDPERLLALERELAADPRPLDPWLVYCDALLAAGDPRGDLISASVRSESLTVADLPRVLRRRSRAFKLARDQLLGGFAPHGRSLHLAFFRGIVHAYASAPFRTQARAELEALLAAPVLALARGLGLRLVSEDPRDAGDFAVLRGFERAGPAFRFLAVESVTRPPAPALGELEGRGLEVAWNPESLPPAAVRPASALSDRLEREYGPGFGLAVFDLERTRASTSGVLELPAVVECLVLDQLAMRCSHLGPSLPGLLQGLLAFETGLVLQAASEGGDNFAGFAGRRDDRVLLELELEGEALELSATFDGRRLLAAVRPVEP